MQCDVLEMWQGLGRCNKVFDSARLTPGLQELFAEIMGEI